MRAPALVNPHGSGYLFDPMSARISLAYDAVVLSSVLKVTSTLHNFSINGRNGSKRTS